MSEELNLEKLKIHERLTVIETKFDGMDEKVDVIYKNIVGSNGNVGLVTKVDRLEQTEKDRRNSANRLWTAVIGTGVGLIGKVFYDLFKK